MPRKTPEKGSPNFSHLTDSQVYRFRDTVNEMLKCFEGVDNVPDLLPFWKALNSESMDRVSNSDMEDNPKHKKSLRKKFSKRT